MTRLTDLLTHLRRTYLGPRLRPLTERDIERLRAGLRRKG